MAKFEIEAPDYPGYRFVGFMRRKYVKEGLYVIDYTGNLFLIPQHDSDFAPEGPAMVYEKIKPKEYRFRESAEKRRAYPGELYINIHGSIRMANSDTSNTYTILEPITDESDNG